MAVAQAEGRTVLSVAARDVGPFRVERLEVEHPGAAASVPAQLQHRRGRLLGATLIAPRDRLEQRLRELTDAPDDRPTVGPCPQRKPAWYSAQGQ